MECGIASGSGLFAKTKSIFRERNAIVLEIITSNLSMDPPVFIVCRFMEDFICLKMVNQVVIKRNRILYNCQNLHQARS